MLFLSGFEPYSRWVPLLSTVLSVLLIKIKIKIKIKITITIKIKIKIKQQQRRRQSENRSPEQMNSRSFKL